jgi:hypothetical protein
MIHSRRSLFAGAVLLLTHVAGCGRRQVLVPVRGRVVFEDGLPVAHGTIEFMPRGGGAAGRSTIDTAGRFSLTTAGRTGAVLGEHDVIVVQFAVAEGVVPHVHPAGIPVKNGRKVDPRHSRAASSGLTAVVTSGHPNDLVIRVSPLKAPR